MTNQEENKEAIEFLQKILAENKQLKEDFLFMVELKNHQKEQIAQLKKTATLPPAVYNFNIN